MWLGISRQLEWRVLAGLVDGDVAWFGSVCEIDFDWSKETILGLGRQLEWRVLAN